jgi:hypothetical protein
MKMRVSPARLAYYVKEMGYSIPEWNARCLLVDPTADVSVSLLQQYLRGDDKLFRRMTMERAWLLAASLGFAVQDILEDVDEVGGMVDYYSKQKDRAWDALCEMAARAPLNKTNVAYARSVPYRIAAIRTRFARETPTRAGIVQTLRELPEVVAAPQPPTPIAPSTEPTPPTRRGRGRPRKHAAPDAQQSEQADS